MTERPILFSGPMIRALLAGKKTQTRRIVKAPKCATVHGRVSYDDRHFVDVGGAFTPKGEQYIHWAYGGGDLGKDILQQRVFSPHGTIGDRLWVRETWCELDDDHRHDLTKLRDAMIEFGGKTALRRNGAAYAADITPGDESDRIRKEYGYKWKPSIFMQRWASRITLEIVRVRVERLHAITEDDARAEGVDGLIPTFASTHLKGVRPMPCHVATTCREHFEWLWDKINGKRAPWASNPWVWVLEFRRIRP
jgi:hypothetical protein